MSDDLNRTTGAGDAPVVSDYEIRETALREAVKIVAANPVQHSPLDLAQRFYDFLTGKAGS